MYVNIYLPSTVCFETNFILLCQYFDIMKNKDELKNIFLMSTKNCTEDRAIFIVHDEKARLLGDEKIKKNISHYCFWLTIHISNDSFRDKRYQSIC